MANPEHLEILKQGVEVWNTWRKENSAVRPELAQAILAEQYLRLAVLVNADLKGAILTEANLVRAVLASADLRESNLTGAVLRSADLRGADLRRAVLADTHLRGADLRDAHLQGADLHGADVARAEFGWTAIGDLDLSCTKGLAEVRHFGPSFLAITTLERTAAGLADDASRRGEVEAFFRSAGVSEIYLDTFQLSIGQPIEFYSSFISYSHTDQRFSRRLHDQLQARGIRCWLDQHDLKPGDRILDVVNDAIRLHDKILLCCSEASLNSWWVKDEIEKALERERREGRDIIIPLNLDGYLLGDWKSGQASTIRSRLAADFTGWEHHNAKFDEQFEKVVRALRTDERSREKAPESKL